MPTSLTITAKGQVTLRREILNHLGLKPGERVEVDLVAPGRVELHKPPTGSIEAFIGCLPDNGVRVSIEEIEEAIREGWSRN